MTRPDAVRQSRTCGSTASIGRLNFTPLLSARKLGASMGGLHLHFLHLETLSRNMLFSCEWKVLPSVILSPE